MQKFITLAEGTEKPILLPTDITQITETNSRDPKTPDMKNISVASRKSAQLAYMTDKHWNTSANEIANALRAAGKTLIEMPYVWGEDPIGRQFVDPSALTFISTSAPSVRPNETEPTMAILIGLKGGGYVESYAVAEKTVAAFMDAARASNPAIKTITPDAATSRFYRAGFTAYDPADVVRVYPNGYQVNVLYRDGFCSDFDLPRVDHVNEQLNRLFKRVVRMRGDTKAAQDAIWTDKPLMDRISQHCYRYETRKRESLTRAFAAAVAADRPDLYAFKTAENFYYTSLDNVSNVRQHEKGLYVDYIKSSPEGNGMHSGGRLVGFKDETAARAALKDLQRHLR
jgi:hypothetical protein